MNEVDLINWFLTAITIYGPALLGVILFVGALGLPLPGTLFLVAAGALAQQGSIDWVTASSLGLTGVVLGDSIGYGLGRSAGNWFQPRAVRGSKWQKAQERFSQQGGVAIYLTRFLFTPFAVPTNLIAGGSGYTFKQFLRYDVAGELTWIALYGGLGYVAGSQWEVISQTVSNYTSVLMGLLVAATAVYLLTRSHFASQKSSLAV
jgi:membrane protein DedA with SNARE-associated domain